LACIFLTRLDTGRILQPDLQLLPVLFDLELGGPGGLDHIQLVQGLPAQRLAPPTIDRCQSVQLIDGGSMTCVNGRHILFSRWLLMARMDAERKIMNHKFRTRLRELLVETGQTQRALAQAAGVSPGVISKYLSDPDRDPMFHIVAQIAHHFDVSPEWLGGMSDERTPFQQGSINDIYFRLSNTGKNELYHYGQYLLSKEEHLEEGGSPYLVRPRAEESADMAGELDASGQDQANLQIIPKVADFAITITGSSMEPLIKAGTLVFAKDQSSAENGDIVAAEVDGQVTCRRYFTKGGRVELHPVNEMFDKIKKYESMRILGKVII